MESNFLFKFDAKDHCPYQIEPAAAILFMLASEITATRIGNGVCSQRFFDSLLEKSPRHLKAR
jgi:hypothetical protein